MTADDSRARHEMSQTVGIAFGLTLVPALIMLACGVVILVDHFMHHGVGPGRVNYFEDFDVFVGGTFVVGGLIEAAMAALVRRFGSRARVAFSVLAVPALIMTWLMRILGDGVAITVALALVTACVLVWLPPSRRQMGP